MPFNGSGIYQLLPDTVVITGAVIESVPFNAQMSDFVTALNTTVSLQRGGTGGSSAATARTSLGLEIGKDVQAYNLTLSYFASLNPAADKIPYFNGTNSANLATFTSTGRSLMAATSTTNARTTLDVPSNAQAVLQTGVGTSANQVLRLDELARIPAVDGSQVTGLSVPVVKALLYEQRTGEGGDFIGNTWIRRVLNTEVDPDGLVTLALSQFIPTFDCVVEFSAPAYNAHRHMARIFNVTDNNVACYGHVQFSAGTSGISSGVGILKAGKQYELQHRCTNTQRTNGRGLELPGFNSVFGLVVLTKI